MPRVEFLSKTAVFLLLFALLPASASAARKHKARSLEVYSSIDDSDGGVADASLFAPVLPGSLGTPVHIVQVAHSKPSHAKKASASHDAAPLIYDNVPADQVDPIITRLRLVGQLILRYGRAYDYRTMTVQELETILHRLDANEAAQARAVTLRQERKSADSAALDSSDRDDQLRESLRQGQRAAASMKVTQAGT
jgi:hypothetical protein